MLFEESSQILSCFILALASMAVLIFFFSVLATVPVFTHHNFHDSFFMLKAQVNFQCNNYHHVNNLSFNIQKSEMMLQQCTSILIFTVKPKQIPQDTIKILDNQQLF